MTTAKYPMIHGSAGQGGRHILLGGEGKRTIVDAGVSLVGSLVCDFIAQNNTMSVDVV